VTRLPAGSTLESGGRGWWSPGLAVHPLWNRPKEDNRHGYKQASQSWNSRRDGGELGPLEPGCALEVGQKAPDFKLDASNGQAVQLADLLGKGPVVIYTFIQAFGGV
jgi:AhpC/TSA family